MKRMLKIELSRALKNKMLLITILIGAVITVSQFIQYVLPLGLDMQLSDKSRHLPPDKIRLFRGSVFCYWIGFQLTNMQRYLYILLLPILATLPFGGSYFSDCKSSFTKNLFVRTKKRNYLVAKYAAVFLSGGIAVVTPLLLNLLLSAAVLPSVLPQTTEGCYFGSFAMWCDLFFHLPYVYIAGYLAIIFVFSGLLASIALSISFFSENRFVVLLAPFLLYLFTYSMLDFLGLYRYNPVIFLSPLQPVEFISFGIIACEAVILALVTGSIFFGKGLRNDTF